MHVHDGARKWFQRSEKFTSFHSFKEIILKIIGHVKLKAHYSIIDTLSEGLIEPQILSFIMVYK